MSKTKKQKGVLNVDFAPLTEEMEEMCHFISDLPEFQEWTLQQLESLEDLRHFALRLADEAEAVMKTFEGKNSN